MTQDNADRVSEEMEAVRKDTGEDAIRGNALSAIRLWQVNHSTYSIATLIEIMNQLVSLQAVTKSKVKALEVEIQKVIEELTNARNELRESMRKKWGINIPNDYFGNDLFDVINKLDRIKLKLEALAVVSKE